MSDKWVMLNGLLLQEKEAFIPVTDRGFLFGEGIFTSIRVNNGECEFLGAHLERLCRQAECLSFNLDSFDSALLVELIDRNQARKGIWRLKIIGTVADKEGRRETGTLLAGMEPAQDLSFYPCTLTLFPYPVESPLAHIKSLAYLDRLYVRDYAKRRGYTDAITRTGNGILLETGCSNIFWFDQGKYWMPDHCLPYLKGVFLQSILPYLTFPVEMVSAAMDQFSPTANVYICNALTHVRAVTAIDQTLFSRSEHIEHELSRAISRALQGNH